MADDERAGQNESMLDPDLDTGSEPDQPASEPEEASESASGKDAGGNETPDVPPGSGMRPSAG